MKRFLGITALLVLIAAGLFFALRPSIPDGTPSDRDLAPTGSNQSAKLQAVATPTPEPKLERLDMAKDLNAPPPMSARRSPLSPYSNFARIASPIVTVLVAPCAIAFAPPGIRIMS